MNETDSRNILVVEDEPAILSLITKILAAEGHNVRAATDGRHALAILGQQDFDVIVLDVMMPSVDGFEVLAQLRASGSLRSTRVLMLTALGKDSDWLRGLKAGAHDYLTKPFDHDELVDVIERLLTLDARDVAAYREKTMERTRLLAQLESLFGP